MERKRTLQIFLAVLSLILIYCLFQKFSVVVNFFQFIFSVLSPILLGFILAFVLNLPMRGLEKLWDRVGFFLSKKRKKKQKESVAKRQKRKAGELFRRPVCLLLSISVILLAASFLFALVIPEIIKAMMLLFYEAPGYLKNLKNLTLQYVDEYPMVKNYILNTEIDWAAVEKTVLSAIGSGTIGVVSGTFGYLISTLGGIFDFIVALIFSIYVLLSKEKLADQVAALMKAFLPEKARKTAFHVAGTSHRIFSSFVVGQCVEALILGSLCVIGMMILRFPYAIMIGSLVGATALIPVVGAFIGAGVGAFLILIQNPFQALMFLLFIVILQQIEGNIIYPKVVGTSVGLPAMWVLAAVVIGGGLGGVVGMLFAVPTVSVIYYLLREYTQSRLKEKSMKEEGKK